MYAYAAYRRKKRSKTQSRQQHHPSHHHVQNITKISQKEQVSNVYLMALQIDLVDNFIELVRLERHEEEKFIFYFLRKNEGELD